MTPAFQSDSLTVYQGDWRAALAALPANSVHCCVTSPPYWGLRDYNVRGQLGLEHSLEHYLKAMVLGFREVWRVLRTDGTLWLNMGDTYAASGGHNDANYKERRSEIAVTSKTDFTFREFRNGAGAGLRPKNLFGVPWKLAFALQADGWFLRCDIVWHKPNPMPESVNDRPTKAHEYLFLLSKSKSYYYDAEAIKEPASPNTHARGHGVNPKAAKMPGKGSRLFINRDPAHLAKQPKQNRSFSAAVAGLVSHRNKRSVWTISAKPYRGAHFATFPPDLVEPCILAGTSERGCCPSCGKSWKRVIEKGENNLEWQRACGGSQTGEYHGQATKDYAAAKAQNASATKARILKGMVTKKTIGWVQSCRCAEHVPIPCTVLDPFGGSGTTGKVAMSHRRRAVLLELNPAYIPLILERCK
jgi:DNA modification methylase